MIYKFLWTEFKATLISKNINHQMVESSSVYQLSAFDSEITYLCTITKTTPASADQLDYEANYRSLANQKISNKVDLPVGASTEATLSSINVKTPEIYRVTYSTASLFSPSATAATDVFTITGSATKTVRIHKIKITMTTTSGSAVRTPFTLIRRSTANTGGISAVTTIVPHDSLDAAATAVIRQYTTNPVTLGTQVGLIRAEQSGVATTGVNGGVIEWIFDNTSFKPLILRGVSQSLSINLNGTSIAGPVMGVSVEWSEE